ncbi:hypothetical protein AYO38_08995 [bacterium SCGC AG-212-C10]|nr:hypothetical protein AYO38_08995 [bacterium SCGC AG-212-C10]
MAEYEYQNSEAWNTALKLAATVGRLKIASNLKASADAQAKAFEQAGLAVALIAEGTGREGNAQVGLYRDARGALAQCRAWVHVLAAVTNEQDSVFGNELDLAEQCSRQLSASIRNAERGPAPGMGGGGGQGPLARPQGRGPAPAGFRPGGPPRQGGPR